MLASMKLGTLPLSRFASASTLMNTMRPLQYRSFVYRSSFGASSTAKFSTHTIRDSIRQSPTIISSTYIRTTFKPSLNHARFYATPVDDKTPDEIKAAAKLQVEQQASKKYAHAHQKTAKSAIAEESNQVAWKDLFRLFQLAKYDGKLLTLAISLLLISCSIGMMIPKAYGLVLDATKSIVDGELPSIIYGLSLYEFVAALAGLIVIGVSANYCRIYLLRILGEKLVARLRSRVIKKTMSQDAEFFDVHKVGDLISRLSSDAFVVSRAMTQNISDGFRALITGSVGVGAMFLICPQLASSIFIFVPAMLMGTIIFGKKVRQISRGIQEATGNLTKVSEEQLSGIKTVQSFVAESKEVHKYNHAIRRVFNLGQKEAVLNASFYSGTSLIGDGSFLIILAYGAQLIMQGVITVGDLAAFMLYAEYTSTAMLGLATFYSELMKGTGAASRLFDLVDREPKINATVGVPLLHKPIGEIEFRNVSFSYPTRPKIQIFKDLNFKIPASSNVCVVGPSGRGKSTITSLILRYYDPTSGEILLDGKDISKYNLRSLRRYLGVVQQEPILMSGTIRDNITYGLKEINVDESKIIEAAKKANCHDFIEKFPDGYDTIIGPRGALLSGGQKQRISIARALIKNPSVLILDEATSALDSKSEYAITQTLQRLMRDEQLTTISIAHRLSTIRKADIIIVLGYDGKVAEIGRFEHLYSNHESALYKLLNEDKSEMQPKKKEEKKEEEIEYDFPQELNDDFIKNEIIQKALGELKFDDAEIPKAIPSSPPPLEKKASQTPKR